MWKLLKFHHISPPKNKKGIFRTLPLVRPTVHEIWKIMQCRHCKAPKNKTKNGCLGHFRLPEGYTYIRPPMVNQVLRSF